MSEPMTVASVIKFIGAFLSAALGYVGHLANSVTLLRWADRVLGWGSPKAMLRWDVEDPEYLRIRATNLGSAASFSAVTTVESSCAGWNPPLRDGQEIAVPWTGTTADSVLLKKREARKLEIAKIAGEWDPEGTVTGVHLMHLADGQGSSSASGIWNPAGLNDEDLLSARVDIFSDPEEPRQLRKPFRFSLRSEAGRLKLSWSGGVVVLPLGLRESEVTQPQSSEERPESSPTTPEAMPDRKTAAAFGEPGPAEGDSREELDLIRRVDELLDARGFTEALESVRGALEEQALGDKTATAKSQFQCGGLLIDIGTAMGDGPIIEEGLALVETAAEADEQELDAHAVEYCLGNGYYSLYQLQVRGQQLKFSPHNIGILVEAKNHFWRGVRALEDSGAAPFAEIYVNLGNTLDSCGRVIEAIRYYDRALELAPTHGMAHLNRGIALRTLNELSDTFTMNQVLQQLRHFRMALQDTSLSTGPRETAKAYRDHFREFLDSHEVSETLEEHERHAAEEAEVADPIRRFFVESNLVLNDHALYCRCRGAFADNLRIPKSTEPIGGEFVPAMELLLNRMRGEFAHARMLYYWYGQLARDIDVFEPEYCELFDNEELGMRTEGLRTAFRLCFGVLDRIALAVCLLFDLAGEDEHIYFESFWRKPGARGEKQKERWQRVNEAENWGLVALYSQATDLSTSGGEWRHYKRWRNLLEHEAFVLTTGAIDLGPWVKGPVEARIGSVLIDQFERETLHLLQFTAAAIFYFTYCVRAEGMKALGNGGSAVRLDKRRRNRP